MDIIKIDNIGSFLLPDEFKKFTGNIDEIEVYQAELTTPSQILTRINDGKAVLLIGEYQYADGIYRFCQRNENKLIMPEEIPGQDYYQGQALKTEIKRKKLHRLLFAACNDELLFIKNQPNAEGLQKWLIEDTGGQPYLIPVRRYQRILTDMKRASEGMYFDILNDSITIYPFVYVPWDKSVPYMILEYEPFFHGKRILDVGTGTGILAILAAKMNAKSVTATDINPNAVSCARENVNRLGLSHIINVKDAGSLFEPVKNEIFDIVMLNAPWIQGEPKSLYDYALYDHNYKVINKFLSEVSNHLEQDGFVLLQYSDISQKKGENSIDNLYSSIERNGLKIAAKSSITRRSRILGATENVYLFKINREQ